MDSSAPTTPASHRCLLPSRLEEPTESTSPLPTHPSAKRSPSISIHSPHHPVALQDFLLLSPSPHRKSRPRPRPIILEECIDSAGAALTPGSSRRKGKSRANGISPRNARRARRRLEKEIVREERELAVPLEEETGRVRRKKQSRGKSTSRNERLALVTLLDPSSPSREKKCERGIEDEETAGSRNGPWEMIEELIMWKNAAKSSLWFGLGTMFFMSSCFSKDVSFSMISAFSHLGLLVLGLAFLYDSFPQSRQEQRPRGESFKLKEEYLLRVARLVLPVANAALGKSQEVFSGEPLMTLKVAPILVFTAKYGHLITPWRLLATGFFLSFTLPKLYSCYSDSIQKKVEEMRIYVWEAWKSCPHKRFVAASTIMVLWNLFSVKMRLFAAFITIAVLRYHHRQQQHTDGESAENESNGGELQQQHTDGESAENESKGELQQAIAVAE